MVYIVALLIFIGMAAAGWFCAAALYKASYECPSPTTGSGGIAGIAIGLVALNSFIPFPTGLVTELIIWAVAVYRFLPLPFARASALMGYLALMSVVTRLVSLGVLAY